MTPVCHAHMRDGAATPALSAVPSAAALARYSHGRKKPSRPAPLNCSAQPARRAATCLGPTRSAHLIRPPLRAHKEPLRIQERGIGSAPLKCSFHGPKPQPLEPHR